MDTLIVVSIFFLGSAVCPEKGMESLGEISYWIAILIGMTPLIKELFRILQKK